MKKLLALFPKPSHYAGNEAGAVRKDTDAVALRIALAFPDTYEIGMSYLGHKILYGIINARENWWAERVMAPEPEAGDILRSRDVPLGTLESGTPLGEMDILGFAVTHELCYTNVLYMLELARIPLRACDRSEDLGACPLIVAGGGALLSAEPLAPFIDLMLLGDGEESIVELAELAETGKKSGWSRSRLLREASRIRGAYVPGFFSETESGRLEPVYPDHARPTRRIVENLENAPYPVQQVVPVGAIHRRLALEIARGCTRGCRFCHAGTVYRPVRERSVQSIVSLMRASLQATGFDEMSFLSLSTGDFSALKHLCGAVADDCIRNCVSLSLPSLRVGSVNEEILGEMEGMRRTGCTLAPEAGSQRLRDVINKGITEEDLIRHARKLLQYGWRQVKLYFMVGLPTETDHDLEEIFNICKKVRFAAGSSGPRLQVTASLSPFVPKPFTPFQWADQISLEELQRRIGIVRQLFRNEKGLKLHWHEPAMSRLEGILARGDRSLARAVELAYRNGAIFCGWSERFSMQPWEKAFADASIRPESYLAGHSIHDALPWDHLEAGVSRQFLLREWEKAKKAATSPDCRYGACQMCGACDGANSPSLLKGPAPADKPETYKNRLVFKKRDQESPSVNESGNESGNWEMPCRSRRKPLPPAPASVLKQKKRHYRIWHGKMSDSAFFSQLELQDIFAGAMRRARLPLAFSQGFHPMPLVSFGRALPVGMESNAEWLSATFYEEIAASEAREKLNSFLPAGIRISGIFEVESSRRTEQAVAETFNLRFIDDSQLHMAIKNFLDFSGRTDFVINYRSKKKESTLDIRPFLKEWRASGDEKAPGLTFVANWQDNYFSPLKLAMAILAENFTETDLRLGMRLVKTAQHFAGGETYQPDLSQEF